MAKARLLDLGLGASGGISNRTRLERPRQILDLQYQDTAHGVILQRKTKAHQHTTEKQRIQRAKWTAWDCLWSRMSAALRALLFQMYDEANLAKQLQTSPYHYLMHLGLTDTILSEIDKLHPICISRPEITITSSQVYVTYHIALCDPGGLNRWDSRA